MAEVYLFLYCVEKSLRLFIEKVAKDKLGKGYFNILQIRREIPEQIEIRKKDEAKNKWLRFRGDSEKIPV